MIRLDAYVKDYKLSCCKGLIVVGLGGGVREKFDPRNKKVGVVYFEQK